MGSLQKSQYPKYRLGIIKKEPRQQG
jgi:hypothetical protein